MLPKIDPTATAAWKKLATHHTEMQRVHMKRLFAEDPERFTKFSVRFDDILVDYSKNRVTVETLSLLQNLAGACGLKDAIGKLFAGEPINETENRAVLHTALRNRANTPVYADGRDVMPDVHAVLAKMKGFSEQVRSGAWRGTPARRLRTSSTSASAARISGRSWSRSVCGPTQRKACACISSQMSTALTSPKF